MREGSARPLQPAVGPSLAASSHRLGYIDWTRGLAILIMIQAHVVDAYTRAADKTLPVYRALVFGFGLAAPLFLFLAGLAAVLASESRVRRGGDRTAAFAATARRGAEVFGLALLFRLQSYALGGFAVPANLMKVDILNIMGPSIVLVAAVWALCRRPAIRCAVFAAGVVAFAVFTAEVRAAAWLTPLPDPLEWYLRPRPGSSAFSLFPWVGFAMAGAATGVALLLPVAREHPHRSHGWLLAAGLAMLALSLVAARAPVPARHGQPWSVSPSFFFLRLGIVIAVLGAAYFFLRSSGASGSHGRPGLLQEYGRSSLFVYWVHVELVYGWFSEPVKRSLPLAWSLVAFGCWSVGLFVLSRWKNRLVGRAETAAVAARIR